MQAYQLYFSSIIVKHIILGLDIVDLRFTTLSCTFVVLRLSALVRSEGNIILKMC